MVSDLHKELGCCLTRTLDCAWHLRVDLLKSQSNSEVLIIHPFNDGDSQLGGHAVDYSVMTLRV